MKKELNVNEILREAARKQISPFTIIKRKINYRKQNKKDILLDKCCGTCRFKCSAKYNAIDKIQCHWIGISPFVQSEVEITCACNWYELGYIRCQEEEDG